MEHRMIDGVVVALLVGVAGGLIPIAFGRQLENLARSGGGKVAIIGVAGLLIVVAVLLLVGQVSDFIVPIPVPMPDPSLPEWRGTLINAGIITYMVLGTWFVLFRFGVVPGPARSSASGSTGGIGMLSHLSGMYLIGASMTLFIARHQVVHMASADLASLEFAQLPSMAVTGVGLSLLGGQVISICANQFGAGAPTGGALRRRAVIGGAGLVGAISGIMLLSLF